MGSSAVTCQFVCVRGRQIATGYEGRATLPAAFSWRRGAERVCVLCPEVQVSCSCRWSRVHLDSLILLEGGVGPLVLGQGRIS